MTIEISDIQFSSKVLVTEQEVDLSGLTESQKSLYIRLFSHIADIYESKNKSRIIVGLTGPTGSGKSVLAEIFKQLAAQVVPPFRFETVGIDAFHYPNTYLLSHDVSGVPLKNYKGRYDTYNVKKIVGTLTDFKEGKTVSFPEYSRALHDPVENAIVVKEEKALLLIEGLWLLYGNDGWEQIGSLLDYSFFLEADVRAVRTFVIGRHARGGRTAEDATRYYDEVDMKNSDLVNLTKQRADEIIPSYFYQ